MWCRANEKIMPSINVEEWGWERKNDEYFHRWMTLPEASKACQELVKCGCTQQCTKGRCKCRNSNLTCTELCNCKGGCE